MIQSVRLSFGSATRFSSRLALVGVLAASIGVVACSSGGSNSTGGGGTTVKAEAGYKFNPSTVNVEAGKDVELKLDNVDSIAHDLKIEGVAGAAIPETAAKKSATVKFKAPAAGTYKIICDLPGHAEAGMVGQLVVK